MALPRNVGLRGYRYKGGTPMWTWLLHRISGLGIIIFVSLHVIGSFFMQQEGVLNNVGTTINIIYESIYFQVFIYFCVIFHTINGTRVILLDFWPKLLEYQKEVTWLQWFIFVTVYGFTIFLMIRNAVAGG